jgi:hypothetical protein
MPANHKVSVPWQIVFTFLPVVNFWAFYRIRKLRKYMLYVFVPSIALSIIILAYVSSVGMWVGVPAGEPDPDAFSSNLLWQQFSPVTILGNVIGWGLQGFAIYLVFIWSRQHNGSFDVRGNRM